jgi:uncharacterized protein
MASSEHPINQPATASRPLWKRIRRGIVVYAVLAYLAVTLIMAVFQRRLMYLPTIADSLTTSDVGLAGQGIRDVQIKTPDGAILNGWLLRHTVVSGQQPAPLLIYFPGNAQHRFHRLADLQEIASYGFDVLIFDYRGYGDSTGAPSERVLSADAKLIWEFAWNQLNYSPDQTVIFGESLGGGVALSLWSSDQATHPQPAALILNSTFASMSETVAWHYPVFPFRWLLLDRWPSIERVPAVKCPVVVFHGTADTIIPVEQGRALADAATDARYVETRGGGHNNIPWQKLQLELDRIRETIAESTTSE